MSNNNSKKIVNESKEKLDKVCTINCKTENGNEKLNALFSKLMIKTFCYKEEEVEEMTTNDLLNTLRKFSKKYKIHLSYVFFSVKIEEGLSGSLIDRNTSAYEMICTAYAETLDELFKKLILCIYFYVKDKKQKGE